MNLREWALPVYTILVQMSAGALLCLWLVRARLYSHYEAAEKDRVNKAPVLIILLTTIIGIFGAHYHLSKPFFSIFAVINFSHSWLSREIAFTIAFFLVLTLLTILTWFVEGRQTLKGVLGWIAAAIGAATVYSMARVYMLPTQIAWNLPETVLSYFGETLLLGATSLAAILLMDLNFSQVRAPEQSRVHEAVISRALPGLLMVACTGLFITLSSSALHITALQGASEAAAQTSLSLWLDLYQPLFIAQVGLVIIGVGWLMVSVLRTLRLKLPVRELLSPAYIAAILVLVAGVLGRFIFYAMHVRTGI